MPANLQISSLTPVGLIADDVTQVGDAIFVTVRAGARVAMCPLCGSPSQRIHSLCPAGLGPPLLRSGRFPSRCDTSISLHCDTLPKANICRTLRRNGAL
jgi:hypothetical protein